MAWVKIDDQFFVNRKSRRAGLEGRALFIASVCYCAMQLNDGLFDADDLPVIAAMAGVSPDVSSRLVDLGLWHEHDGSFEVHQYLDHNPSREQVIARKERAVKAASVRHGATSNATSRATGNADGLPIPSPSPDTSSSSSEQVNPPAPSSLWKKIAEKQADASSSQIVNRSAWVRKAAANAKEEHAERAAWLLATYEITESQLVDVLLSGGSSPLLNSLRRKDAA